MANKKQQTETPAPATDDAHANRIRILQDSTDEVCDRIQGTARSLTSRAIRARSVAPKVVEAAFAAIESALQEGREEYARAQQDDDTGRAARVDLASL